MIAPVVAADPEAELPWLASEYVPGPSVTDVAMEFGPLGDAGLRTLTHGLALALAEVHAAGVVHRDVKPSNVLLARDGPRLIDFGVARAIDDIGLTRVGALIGSPGFLSPEQAVGEAATFASDMFSLASVVAYAARGQSPFGAGDGAALLYRVVHEPPKLEGLPADLTEVLAACLAKDPGERPTAPEIAELVPPEEPWLPDAVVEDIARREAELAAWLQVTAADPLWVRAVSAAFDKAADSALDIANAAVVEPPQRGTRRREPGSTRRPKAADATHGADSPTTGLRRRHRSDSPADGTRHPHRTDSPTARTHHPEAADAAHSTDSPTTGTRDPHRTDSPADGTRHPKADTASGTDSPTHGTRQPGLPRRSAAQPKPVATAAESAPPDLLPHPETTPPGAAYTAFLLDPLPDPPAAPSSTTHRAPRRRHFPVYAALGAILGAAATAAVLLLAHGGSGGHSTPPPQNPASVSATHGAPAPHK